MTGPVATKKASESGVIREGWATVKRTGLLAFLPWPRRFIVLGDKTLAIRTCEGGAQRGAVELHEVSRIERVETKPYCILVETRGARKFYLNLNSDSEVVDWQDDIYSRTPLRGGDPTDFKHLNGAKFDIATGQFVGLPQEWANTNLNGTQS
ncbi:hypothetical protein BKA62DRAFT_735216 [Auriculariales sp. MPI-PUGE-AT-0066]|nr:hypothetical protein BKA62DRAFT_735216 [Auriculariales sp. MPI-PUGE-AT-0066]